MTSRIIISLKLTVLSFILAGCQCLTLECDIVLAEEDGKMMRKDKMMMDDAPSKSMVPTRFEVRNKRLYAAGDSGALVLVPSSSFFAFDSAALTNTAKRDVNTHALYLRRNPNRRVTIEGHTDERGSNEYNLALGDRRAKRVADHMRTRGVAGSQMRTVSYGEERPADNRSNETGWGNNRRAVIIYQ